MGRLLLAALLLLFVIAAVRAEFIDEFGTDDEFKRVAKQVFSTWIKNKHAKNLGDAELDDAAAKQRAKSRYLPLEDQWLPPGEFATCNLPGYTGENCANPICNVTNNNVPNFPAFSGTGASIDLNYQQPCGTPHLTYIDSSLVGGIRFEITSFAATSPSVVIYNSAGIPISPNSFHQGDSQYQALFDYLPPGPYTIAPQTSNTSVECIIFVNAFTNMTMTVGWVTLGNFGQPERYDFPVATAIQGMANTFVSHINNLRFPGQQTQFLSNYGLSTRYGCGYEQFFQSFLCRTTGSYIYVVEGYDFYGNNFRRANSFQCIVDPAASTGPTTIPTPPPGGLKCRNDGILLNATDGSQFCYCQPLFTGVDCGAILCANGGTPHGSGLLCICPPGFQGPHCEDVVCDPRSSHGFGVDQPRLIFVIRTKYTMTELIQPIIDNLIRVVNIYNFDPNYLSRFGLVLFNNNQVSLIQTYSSLTAMITDLRAVQLSPSTDGGCTDSVLTALASVFSGVLASSKSPVYVFTDALANDDQLEETIYQRNAYWRSSIYFVYVTPPSDSGCSTDPFDSGYRVLNRIAIRTAGHVFNVPDRTKTGELFYQHSLNTLYRMNYVMMNDPTQCTNQPQFQPIMVDTNLAQLTITATGTQLSLNIMNPDGVTTDPTTNYTLNFTYIWTIRNPHAGQWFISLQSGSPSSACSYRILAINPFNANRDYDFFWATAPYIEVDGLGLSPIYKQSTPLVGHINNYRLTDPYKVFAETTIFANDDMGVRQAVYFSNGIWRDGCSYQLYFGPFTCQRPNQVLYMTVYVRDDIGFMIQRSSMMYCAATHPTFFPPSSCQNGGVQASNGNSTFCLCQPYYTGSLCQNTVCVNGGSDIGGACECAPGHTGLHCEITKCINPNNSTRFGPNEKQIAFVIEMTALSVGGLYQLNTYISTLIRDFQSQHPRWLTTFIVAGYNSTYAAILKTVTADHANSVVDAINEAYNWTVANMDPSCTVQLWQALSLVVKQMDSEGLVFVFHASVPDENGTILYTSDVYNAGLENRVQMNVFFGLAQGNLPCNASRSAFALLFEATAITNGLVYETQLANWNGLIRIMPNYYESSIVYEDFYSDCASQMQTFYVPVDSLTQTLQVTTFGYNSTQTVLTPNGTAFSDAYDLVNDPLTGLRITEIRRGCDVGWEPFGSYCIEFVFARVSWMIAQQYCAVAGGFLADDMTAAKDFFLNDKMDHESFWTGLNDIQQEGVFVWDRPNGTQNTPLGSFTNWAPGHPINDSQHLINCVSMKQIPFGSPAQWYNENCNTSYSFACQKHKYNQNVTVGQISNNDLKPGIWQVQIQTRPGPTKPSVCFVQIRSQSSIQVYPGYVQDPYSDQPGDPNLRSVNNRIIAATTGLQGQNPGYLQYAHLYGTNLTLQRSATYELRSGCNFPFLSQPWACPGDGTRIVAFQVMHVGVDQQGYTFQRLIAGRCITSATYCNNGGIVYQGVCICPPFWTGRTCDTPTCMNNGTLTANNRTCVCPNGYSGPACQYPVCLPQIPQSFSFDSKSFVIAIELTLQNAAVVNRMRGFIPGWLNGIVDQQPNWFTNFILVTFTSSAVSQPIVTTTVNDFSTAFNATSISDFSSNCTRPLFTALTTALQAQQLVVPGSVVWVISKGSPSDLTQESNAFLAIASSGALVNFLVVDDSFRPCGMDPNSPTVAPMIDTALVSGGNAFFLTTQTFTTHLSAYMPTLYQSSLLDTSLNRTCPAGTKWYAQVDAKMTQVVIDTYAFYAQISVTDPHGNPVPTNDLYNSPLNRLVMFSTTDSRAGIYTIAVSTQAPTCIVQVRGSSPLQMFVGYTQATSGNGQNQDDSYFSPVINVNNNLLLVHMNGLTSGGLGSLNYVDMVSARTNRIVSPMMIRSNCSYEYYSNTFRCQDAAFLVAVHGTDDVGQNFRRFVIAFCVNSRPTTTGQPQTTTLSTTMGSTTTGITMGSTSTTMATTGGSTITTTTGTTTSTTPGSPTTSQSTVSTTGPFMLNMDLVVAIDGSASMPNTSFMQVVTFVRTLVIPQYFNGIGQGTPGVRIGLIVVPGANGFLLPAANLQAITSRANLQMQLDELYTYFYDGSPGQMLNSLLSETISPEFLSAGYRPPPAANNHLILYITGTSNATDAGNAVTTAQSIRNANTYGIIAIAYTSAGQTVDPQVLMNIAGPNCFMQATSVDQLNQLGLDFVRQRMLNASTSGMYC